MNGPDSCRFLVDHMLIRLGKYLRIIGYDATWERSLRTHELIRRANMEQRIFLTRNARLEDQYPRPQQVLLVRSTDPVEQFRQVVSEMGLDPHRALFSKCIRCNIYLENVAVKAEICERVHPNVYRQYTAFYRCPSCGTVFWKGSHVRNTCRKLGLPVPPDA